MKVQTWLLLALGFVAPIMATNLDWDKLRETPVYSNEVYRKPKYEANAEHYQQGGEHLCLRQDRNAHKKKKKKKVEPENYDIVHMN